MRCIVVERGVDDTGNPEMFTWDLFALLDTRRTSHLDDNGLPKLGTRIMPGMVVVGKKGKTKLYDAAKMPTSIDALVLEFPEIRSRYGKMWKDTSYYADADTAGVVADAHFEEVDGRVRAIVALNSDRGTLVRKQ